MGIFKHVWKCQTNGFDMDYIIVKQSNMEIQPNNPMKHHGTHSGYANPGHSFGEFFPNTRQKAILSQQLQDGIDFRGIFWSFLIWAMMTSLASNKGNPVHHFLEGKLSDFLSSRAMESELDDWMTEKGEKGRHLIIIQFKRGTWFISHIYIYKIFYI